MKISEICKELNISRQGLYWMIEKTGNNLNGHAIRKASGRWKIDDEGVSLLREIREKSKQVFVIEKPADPHADETIKGMELEITRLRSELEFMWMRYLQGVYLRTSIKDLIDDGKGLDPYAKRELSRLVKAFEDNVKDKAVKKRIKESRKANEPLLESLGQMKLFK